MATYFLSRLVFFLLVFFFSLSASAMDAVLIPRRGLRPGFVYTRARGKCTPQYWSSRTESWPKMVPQMSTVSNVFSSRAYERYRYDLTLLEAASRNDDLGNAFARLLKESTAALLNSYARKGYPYSAWEVKTLLIQALVSKQAAARQAQQFREANGACNKLHLLRPTCFSFGPLIICLGSRDSSYTGFLVSKQAAGLQAENFRKANGGCN